MNFEFAMVGFLSLPYSGTALTTGGLIVVTGWIVRVNIRIIPGATFATKQRSAEQNPIKHSNKIELPGE